MPPITTIHVTHEACDKIGGIGAVLEGLITSPVYQAEIGRTILVGPMINHFDEPGESRLGPGSEVIYSTFDGIDHRNLGYRFRPVEWAFNVALVYGRRTFRAEGGTGDVADDRTGEAEIILIDVFNASKPRVDRFKAQLWERFGLDCAKHEQDWGFEEYVRLAEPGFHAAMALIRPEELPAVVVAHEFMGLPLAFKAILDGADHTRTLFHAHECSTARRLVEAHPGHDLAFYNALDQARTKGLHVTDVYGDQSEHFRHELVVRSHLCDAILAVGSLVADELKFLDPHFAHHDIDLVHNGVPAPLITPPMRLEARKTVRQWAKKVTGVEPDLIFTHVTRPVISKGIWRDLQVCAELDATLADEGRHALLVILTSAGGTRRPQDVAAMVDEYGWPMRHREGYPDLVGPEIEIDRMVAGFNDAHRNVRVVLVNQFGFTAEALGLTGTNAAAAPKLDMAVFRTAADAEFGMATYEPFGISPLEPLAAGAICVISSVCGCAGFVDEVTDGAGHPCVIVADYTTWDGDRDLKTLLAIGQTERDRVEQRVSAEIAAKLAKRLPRNDDDRVRLLAEGQRIVQRLGWDQVLRDHFLPTVRRVIDAVTPVAT